MKAFQADIFRAASRDDAGAVPPATGSAQQSLLAEEESDDLPLVNRLRADVKEWRETRYRGSSAVTKDLLAHWMRRDSVRPLFFRRAARWFTILTASSTKCTFSTKRSQEAAR